MLVEDSAEREDGATELISQWVLQECGWSGQVEGRRGGNVVVWALR